MRKIFAASFIILSFSLLPAQETIRIMTYNVHRFPANKNSADALKTIFSAINPTIIVPVELDGSDAVQQLLTKTLNNKYKASSEVSISWGRGNEAAVFYKDSLFNYLGHILITADPRPIAEFKLVHKFTRDTLIVFGVHLKAFPESENQVRRLNAVNVLRERTKKLNKKANYVVVGDFNIFDYEEPAFKRLLDKSESGYFYDPQNAVGRWTDNILFAHAHTYSPTSLKSRLDMILISESLQEYGGIDYINDSYKIFGNDGLHFGKSITTGSNYWLFNAEIGTALLSASDHLPVYADFSFGVPTTVSTSQEIPSTFELLQNCPNPFNPSTIISYRLAKGGHVSLKIYDLLGREVATLVNEEKPPGYYKVEFSEQQIPENRQLSAGAYFYMLTANNFSSTKKMIYNK